MHDSDRPWLRKDTIYATAPDGVLISNASTGFEIAGRSAYTLFDKVAPLFNGTVSVGEIKSSVPENVWKLMLQIINPLAEHGFLRWIPQTDFDLLPDDLRSQYLDQIAFLAQYTDEPHAAFLDFHEAEIVLVGNDPILDSLRANLSENGASHLTSVSSIDEDVAGDLLIFGPTGLESLDKAKRSAAAQMVICPAGNKIWTLPVRWSRADAHWRSGLNSLRRGAVAGEWDEAFREAKAGNPAWSYATSSEAVQRLYGALLAYEVFKGITGAIKAETGNSLFALDCLSGETEIHKITPIFESVDYKTHEMLASGRGGVDEWDARDAVQARPQFSNADSRSAQYDAYWAPLVDPVTMPAFSFDDLDLPQIPLKVSAVCTRFGVVRTASAWTTADARIDGIATAYGLALSEHTRNDGRPLQTVFGVDRTPHDAVARALELIANAIELAPGVSIGRHVIPGRLGAFIDDVSKGSVALEYMGEVAGFHLVKARAGQWAHTSVGATPEQAQASAALEVLGSAQTGSASDINIELDEDFQTLLTSPPRIRIVALADGWYVAIACANGSCSNQ
ncbi:hypothetical protein [uncultured Actinomyces sp.]|uniref:hypothetical protein n=1 Tax=uncultured Actinomyces sp. TaxID=249061 RepID=UPI002604DD77|nr:hypothetical protein [uncultured Actinomyces sp.]